MISILQKALTLNKIYFNFVLRTIHLLKVEFTDYNPDWINLYNKEKELIVKALGNIPHQIRHVGSTSVPGLGAKPVIDILLGINSFSELPNIIPVLNNLGFEYRNFEHLIPQWAYFTKPSYCHVHCVEVTSDFYRRQIVFRDYLRVHDDIRDEYYSIKKELAQIDWENPTDYSEAKDDFIRSIEKKAVEYITNKIETAEAVKFSEVYCLAPAQVQIESNISYENFGPAIFQSAITQPSDISNRVMNLGIFEEADESFIDFMIDYFSSANSKEINIQLSPIAMPENLLDLLWKKGFFHSGNVSRFYRDTFSVPVLQTDFEVKEIDEEQASVFGKLVEPERINLFTHPIGKQNWHFYIVLDKGKAIAAACMYIHEDTAWFGWAATLEKYKNKGAQSALIAKRIIDAKNLGCKWITSTTSGDEKNASYHNLMKFGFNLMFKRPVFLYKQNK
ncbi:MAG: hypothetical protein EHM58_13995 [Ignavibacteriae bacterium]|nr:MAG: hypothetical protein EHM58_13995 [Ignavibacteriota bacterium]